MVVMRVTVEKGETKSGTPGVLSVVWAPMNEVTFVLIDECSPNNIADSSSKHKSFFGGGVRHSGTELECTTFTHILHDSI